jgi:hypothetical protein
MTRYMYDSVTLTEIPADAQMAATYINGAYAVNDAAYAARFPGVPRLYIDVIGNAFQAQIRDWESGDESMNNLEDWIGNNKNRRPTIYCNRSTISQVRDLTGSKVLGTDYWLWVATLDGTYADTYPDAPPGSVVAVQAWPAPQDGLNCDRSIVFDDTWYPETPAPLWYGNVTTTNPFWVPAKYPAMIAVTSQDGGLTWQKAGNLKLPVVLLCVYSLPWC